MLGTVLLVVLILLLLGALPTWGHSRNWGYAPSGGLGLVVVIIIILLLRAHRRRGPTPSRGARDCRVRADLAGYRPGRRHLGGLCFLAVAATLVTRARAGFGSIASWGSTRAGAAACVPGWRDAR